jgi:hypothetical protein
MSDHEKVDAWQAVNPDAALTQIENYMDLEMTQLRKERLEQSAA